ncbi:Mycothiol acetyltransferase [Vibrio stylophorae]|uniref:Mycothiol acetyltransferase n=1 Tax=Vibrio stylophorae TaxID=659351 RepID=A0ABM8ZTK3_9VIBR|nr:N-acetyltransferase [Vibrio stylophorae]CAH0533624.1 Mycothiol acetyltransferase [Vibrio stylophorae]
MSHPRLIRPIEKHELAAVAELEHKLFGHHSYPDFFFRQAFDCWSEGFLVCRSPQGILGYIVLANSEHAGLGWVLSLAVDDSVQGEGIGRALLQQAMVRLNYQQIRLTVDPENAPACHLYQRLGFFKVGEEQDYFGPGQARWVMAHHAL